MIAFSNRFSNKFSQVRSTNISFEIYGKFSVKHICYYLVVITLKLVRPKFFLKNYIIQSTLLLAEDNKVDWITKIKIFVIRYRITKFIG